jgi:aryl-alcohol dehydrogenase
MSDEVTAAVFREGSDEAHFEKLEMGALRDDEVLVKVVASGICHTDLTCRSGFMPMPRPIVLGHEGAGIVMQVGAGVSSAKPGDRVVMTFLSCGECANCKKSIPAYCFNFMGGNLTGRRLDGSTAFVCDGQDISGHFFGQSSFANYSVASERNVVKVRDDAPLELLAPLGCGIQTGAGAVMNVMKPAAGESLLVFGGGGVGLSAVMAAAVSGCSPIIVVEPVAARRALALEVGATHVLDPAEVTKHEGGVVGAVRALTDGVGVNNAFDTCGIPDVIAQGIDALAPLGKMVLATINKLDATLTLPLLPNLGKGITVRTLNMGDSVPKQFIPKLVDFIVEGRFPLHKLVKEYPFSEINTALEDQESGRTVKPILRM